MTVGAGIYIWDQNLSLPHSRLIHLPLRLPTAIRTLVDDLSDQLHLCSSDDRNL